MPNRVGTASWDEKRSSGASMSPMSRESEKSFTSAKPGRTGRALPMPKQTNGSRLALLSPLPE